MILYNIWKTLYRSMSKWCQRFHKCEMFYSMPNYWSVLSFSWLDFSIKVTDPYLGGLKSELAPNEHIDTFVSAGPKNYAYHTTFDSTTCKIRGFTLNSRNSVKLNFDSMKDIVTTDMTRVVPVTEPHKIVRQKGNILTKPQTKDYRFVYDKRVIGNNFVTYPYGWKGCV